MLAASESDGRAPPKQRFSLVKSAIITADGPLDGREMLSVPLCVDSIFMSLRETSKQGCGNSGVHLPIPSLVRPYLFVQALYSKGRLLS